MKLTISQSLTALNLKSPFSMAELKQAYRQAALKTHPDCGGSEEVFRTVDTAYDTLKPCATDKDIADATYCEQYWNERLDKLEKKFREEWLKAFNQAKTTKSGLWFSTCVERFARAYMHPKAEWFEGVLFKKNNLKNREDYRQLLLEIAPNRKLKEQWALKYYRLEFGFNTPYIFYLPPAKVVE